MYKLVYWEKYIKYIECNIITFGALWVSLYEYRTWVPLCWSNIQILLRYRNSSRAPRFIPVLWWGPCCSFFSVLCFCFVCCLSVSCTQCCLFLWSVHSQFFLTFIPTVLVDYWGSCCSIFSFLCSVL